MKLGIVTGKLWATRKDPQLTGVKLYILQPVNEKQEPMGNPVVAADTVGAGQGDLVYWVSSREATYALPDRKIPCDVSIVGLVDHLFASSDADIDKELTAWKRKNVNRSKK